MTGREFVKALEVEGFVVRRRDTSFVWLTRQEQVLMVDLDAAIPDAFLLRLLAPRRSVSPPSAGRRTRSSSLGTLGRFARATPKA